MPNPNHQGSPETSFAAWFSEIARSGRFKILSAIAAPLAIYNFLVATHALDLGPSMRLKILYGTHATMIFLIAAIIAFGKRPRAHADYPRGSQAVAQFWDWWPRLWFAWALLYVALSVFELMAPQGGHSTLSNLDSQPIAQAKGVEQFAGLLPPWLLTFALHTINNVATLILMMCFHILYQPTLQAAKPGPESNLMQPDPVALEEEADSGGTHSAKFMFWVLLFVAAMLTEFGLAAGAESNSTLLGGATAAEIQYVFGILYGVLAATATALLVGQLNSQFLGVPLWAVVVLFFYAAVQPSFDFVIEDRSSHLLATTRSVILAFALVSKIILFCVVKWLAESERLLYFMVQSYTVHLGVKAHWREFAGKLASR